MSSFGTSVVTDLANLALDYHIRGQALWQTVADKPLLAFLVAGKETFPGGKQYITTPIQGTKMSDTSTFLQGFNEDTSVNFAQSSGVLRPQVAWKEVHAGFVVTFTELKKDGIIVTDGEQRVSEASDVGLTRLTAILKQRLADFTESWKTAFNNMLWNDGTQDSLQVPGVTSLILEDPTAGTVAGIAQATNTFWRSRVKLNLAASPTNQTISKFFRNELIQLKRFGGQPNKALCGSGFWDALMQEVSEKGQYTITGFNKQTDFGVQSISLAGLGTFDYDPTLDTLGLAKDCFVFDSRRIKLMPMEGGEDQMLDPARPYQYMLMLKSHLWTGGLIPSQLNAMGRYRVQ